MRFASLRLCSLMIFICCFRNSLNAISSIISIFPLLKIVYLLSLTVSVGQSRKRKKQRYSLGVGALGLGFELYATSKAGILFFTGNLDKQESSNSSHGNFELYGFSFSSREGIKSSLSPAYIETVVNNNLSMFFLPYINTIWIWMKE